MANKRNCLIERWELKVEVKQEKLTNIYGKKNRINTSHQYQSIRPTMNNRCISWGMRKGWPVKTEGKGLLIGAPVGRAPHKRKLYNWQNN